MNILAFHIIWDNDIWAILGIIIAAILIIKLLKL